VVPPTETEEPLVQDPPTGHLNQPPQQIAATINWSESVYVIFDIETTGGHRTDDDIIELSAWLCGTDGIHIEEGVYDTIVKPCKPINNFIATLTGITTEMVVDARPFPEVAEEFFDFVHQQFHEYARQCDKTISHIVMVAHNGRVFDMPFLLRSLDRFNLLSLWTDNPKFGFLIDTLDIARKAFRES
jgi:DNA polymerase III alpha subunit (gram-positive type)